MKLTTIMPLRIALCWAIFICHAAIAAPVELSADRQGQALIVPVWTAQAGNDTLVTVRNNSDWAVAVKVRIMDAFGGEFAAFNLYLNDDDAWTGALTASSTGAELVTRDGSCLLSHEPDDDSDVIVLPPPGPRAGYLEVMEMARLPKAGLGGALLITRWPDCESLSERFATGDWLDDPSSGLIPPGRNLGGISARVQIIDVAEGGMFSVPATVLDGFTDIVQHSPPDSPVPNLSTAHGENTDSGITESRVCNASGCRILTWSRPVEAVASVLLTRSLRGDVVLNPDIGGMTELVVTRPLKRFEWLDDTEFAIEVEAGLALFDREGAFVEPEIQTVELSPPPPPKTTPVPIAVLETLDPVGVVSFDRPALVQSPILGLSGGSAFSTDGTGFVSGHAEIIFSGQSLEQALTSLESVSLRGEAAIGIAVQQFTNGTLDPDPATGNSVLSNYRTAEEMTRR